MWMKRAIVILPVAGIALWLIAQWLLNINGASIGGVKLPPDSFYVGALLLIFSVQIAVIELVLLVVMVARYARRR